MRILIVDDEPVIRDSLRHVVEHSSLSVHTVLSTSSAEEALVILKENPPEILLSDIQMPVITGIDLARHVYEQKLPTRVIFITGYSDFSYARAGIEYQVFDYLLKPVDEKEAIACIRNAIQSYAQEVRHEEMYQLFQSYFSTHFEAVRRQFLERLLFYPLTWSSMELRLQQKEMKLDFPSFQLCAISFQVSPRHAAEEFYYVYVIEQYLEELRKGIITLPFGSILYFIWPLEEQNTAVIAKRLTEKLQSQYPISLFIGISLPASDFDGMQMLRRQVCQCLDYAKLHPEQRITFYEDLSSNEADEQYFHTQSAVTELIACLRNGDRAGAAKLLTPITDQFLHQPAELGERSIQLYVSHILYFINGLSLPPAELSRIQGTVETQINAQSDITLRIEYFHYWVGYICDCVSGIKTSEQNTLIEAIYDYINRCYAEPIGLTNVSEYINRNPSYVSRLIKLKTNKNFLKILTEKRIEEAKKLLRDPSCKLADIAAQTGYPNLRYFTRVFHTQVNMSPNDYRKMIAAFH